MRGRFQLLVLAATTAAGTIVACASFGGSDTAGANATDAGNTNGDVDASTLPFCTAARSARTVAFCNDFDDDGGSPFPFAGGGEAGAVTDHYYTLPGSLKVKGLTLQLGTVNPNNMPAVVWFDDVLATTP